MFAAILDQLEARRPPGWTTMALDLLSVGNADDQAACERMVEEVRQKIIAAPEDPDQPNFVIRIPPGDRDVALIFHVYPQALRAKCADTVLGVAEHVLDGSDRKRCLVIRRIETWEEVGYEKIAVAGRPD
jgi:hypothetical protein